MISNSKLFRKNHQDNSTSNFSTDAPKLYGREAFDAQVNLSYSEYDTIWIKLGNGIFFVGEVSEDGRFGVWATKGQKKDRVQTTYYDDAFDHISELAYEQDGGVFYIPGKPEEFPLTEYCKESNDIGAEMDDGSEADQRFRIENFAIHSGLIPNFLVSSGGKSLHPHIICKEPLEIKVRTHFSRLFAIAILGDPHVTSPHQPMRISGFYRKREKEGKEGKEQYLQVFTDSRYSEEALEEGFRKYFEFHNYKFPTQSELSDSVWTKIYGVLTNKSLTLTDKQNTIRDLLVNPDKKKVAVAKDSEDYTRGSVPTVSYKGQKIKPLLAYVSRKTSQFVTEGVTEGGRNKTGFRVAFHLIGAENALRRLGIEYSGDSKTLFEQYCNNCNPPIDDWERSQIWDSAEGRDPSSVKSDEILTAIATEDWSKIKKSSKSEVTEVSLEVSPATEATTGELEVSSSTEVTEENLEVSPSPEVRERKLEVKEFNLEEWRKAKLAEAYPDGGIKLWLKGKVIKSTKVESEDLEPGEIYQHPLSEAIAEKIIDRYGSKVKYKWRNSGWTIAYGNPNLPLTIASPKRSQELLETGIVALSYTKGGKIKTTKELNDSLKIFATKKRDITLDVDSLDEKTTEILGIALIEQKCKVYVSHGNLRMPFLRWQQRNLFSISHDTHKLDSQYLDKDIYLSIDDFLTGVKSPKGSGKTHALKSLVDDTRKRLKKVLVIGHRRQLLSGMAVDLDLFLPEDVTESNDDIYTYGMAICADSLVEDSKAKFIPSDWDGALLIIDEVEQFLDHLLSGNTSVKERRVRVLENLGELLVRLQRSGGRILCMDADLTDVSINFFKQLIIDNGGVDFTPRIEENIWQRSSGTRVLNLFHEAKPTQAYEKLCEFIEAGYPVISMIDCVDEASPFSARTLASRIAEKYENKRILVIDSQTTHDPRHEAFSIAERINEALLDIPEEDRANATAKYDVVFISPALGTGVSYEPEKLGLPRVYNKSVSFFSGVNGASGAMQHLERDRCDETERWVWVRSRGTGTYKYNQKTSLDDFTKCRDARYVSDRNTLRNTGRYSLDLTTGTLTGSSIAELTHVKLMVRKNVECVDFRDNFIFYAQSQGYIINDVEHQDGDKAKEIMEEMKDVCDRNFTSVAKDIKSSPVPEGREIWKLKEKLKEKKVKTKDERNLEIKVNLLDLYAIENDEDLTVELIKKDKTEDFYPKAQLDFYRTVGREYLSDRDANVADSIKKTNPKIMKHDLQGKVLGGIIQWMDAVKVTEIASMEQLESDDKNLEEFADRVLGDRTKERLIEVFGQSGITFSKSDSPIKVISRIFDKLGYKLEIVERKRRVNDERYRVYKLTDEFGTIRTEQFKRWKGREIKKRRETLTQSTSQPGPLDSYILIENKTSSSGPESSGPESSVPKSSVPKSGGQAPTPTPTLAGRTPGLTLEAYLTDAFLLDNLASLKWQLASLEERSLASSALELPKSLLDGHFDNPSNSTRAEILIRSKAKSEMPHYKDVLLRDADHWTRFFKITDTELESISSKLPNSPKQLIVSDCECIAF
ncbi:hypothetical protein NIES2100_73860 [Calothrix sp. NIES-2100]|uniref:plasmid replication protein, CyRepA1 family n=1 Tax=Calothrix sp. NIES-2100 TaxID=1954172 RepID=UPI000B5DED8E|nr:hypothetical protein NIES2100_73860 [Calothrix sp. NIES-2100]